MEGLPEERRTRRLDRKYPAGREKREQAMALVSERSFAAVTTQPGRVDFGLGFTRFGVAKKKEGEGGILVCTSLVSEHGPIGRSSR